MKTITLQARYHIWYNGWLNITAQDWQTQKSRLQIWNTGA